ncbi:MAG: class I SAM-dependent methyltransferase [Treponema sp.]|jgi:23S rRNA G2069 N7-methylase RlmK/C1962 C5-methylase RlmI|nr:class I SAM-dependent methyltransferase [Treponema sp.]
MDGKTESQAEMLGNRLRKRHKHLAKWARRCGIGAYRLYDRDIPEIPLVIDLYQGTTVPGGESAAALAGAVYRRPFEKDPAVEASWLAGMEGAMAAALDIPRSRIFMKERRRLRRREEQYEKSDSPEGGFELVINEGKARFLVNLSDYLDTGLFLDRRRVRVLLGEEAAGRRTLNLFAYTCAFSVYAAAGGAASVDSVDLSNTYLDWGRRNFTLNGLGENEKKAGQGLFRFIRADALRFLENAEKEGRKWDLIILDPPAFSNSKKMADTLDIRRDHPRLIARCLRLLNPGGRLWFSAGTGRFRLELGEIEGLAGFGNFKVEEPGDKTIDEDFQGKKASPCYVFSFTPESGALY